MNTRGGGYAEVAVVEKQTVFHIPVSLSFEEASTIPLAGDQSRIIRRPSLLVLTLRNSIHCGRRTVPRPQVTFPVGSHVEVNSVDC